jgi:hypothetical protein
VARIPILALGIIALLSALAAGVLRIGWELPLVPPLLVVVHGPLMVSGFLGTVIGLERAASLGMSWAYAAPIATGLGALALVIDPAMDAGRWLVVAGSFGLLGVFGFLLYRTREPYMLTMTLGACGWVVGNLLWLADWQIHRLVVWWAVFLVLTIAGERQELTRLLPLTSRARTAFQIVVATILGGAVVTLRTPDVGTRVVGLGFGALAAWLGRHDMARRTVDRRGLPRFMAVCLLSGYGWLGIAGVLALCFGIPPAPLQYDAVLHALFLGFVFAMIFGHAPVIFPAILGVVIPFRLRFYIHLIALHATVAIRIVGDLAPAPALRLWGGLLNALVLVAFLASTASAARLPPAPVPATSD